MATEIISIRQPTLENSAVDVLRAQTGLRMLHSYVAEHISCDVEIGPNGGHAGPDITFQCETLISLLDRVYEDLQAIEAKREAA